MRRPVFGGLRSVLIGLVVSGLLTGCTYSDREPGLFGTSAPQPSASTPLADPTSSSGPPSTGPTSWSTAGTDRLPVFGERLWTTGDGSGLTFRIAVHGLRRFDGGTALDWSVTPLPGPGDSLGEPLPTTVNLGLTRFNEGNLNVVLIDPTHDRVYRPLTAADPDQLQHCLCTPIWVAERSLRFGVTTLLQAAFPELPAAVDVADVDVTTVPLFSSVPVLGRGRVPDTATSDLARPAPDQPVLAWTSPFRYPAPPGQQVRLGITQVLAGGSATSIGWVIESVTAGEEIVGITLPPLIAPDAGSRYGYSGGYVSGASVVAVDGRPERPREARRTTAELSGLDQFECLCTDIRLWSGGLVRAGARISVVTLLPSLPDSARRVDVHFPGLPTLRNLPVTREPIPSAGNDPATPRTWTYSALDPPAGWPAAEWPTPLPNPRQIAGYRPTVDRLR